MELFFTDLGSLRRSGPDTSLTGVALPPLPPAALQALENLSVPDGMPFFLDAAGRYDRVLNKFFRDLSADGCRSPRTWRAYARDLHLFARFLDERCGGTPLLRASKDDLRSYYRARRLGLAAVTERSWNRAIAALDRFYRWALSEDLIAALPFDYRYATANIPGHDGSTTVRSNQFLERVGPSEEVKCITLDDYLRFRDIGLLGRLPDGRPDPSFRGRNALRNAAFAELLVTTGLRLTEATRILKAELPDPAADTTANVKTFRMQLAHLTAKRAKGRLVHIPRRVLRDFVLPYIQEDRDNAVAKAVQAGHYRRLDNLLLVTRWTAIHCRLAGHATKKLDYAAIGPEDRAKLFSIGDDGFPSEPGLLWCTEQGLPTEPENFEAVFIRACERCARFGFDIRVTPHTLRHTFAVYMLSELIRASLGSVVDLRQQRRDLDEGAYRRIVFDPLDRLRRLLGHRSLTSTYIYLTYIEEAQELVDQAVDQWSARLGSPDDLLNDEETL
ncbi:site-specific integrase (plasmid) [Azospirillum oryzae]|uniref:Site-specific integrase n=1 Tax=Azospirillum oryzae TaxID=286727 RepID=A0A6N1ARV5_9PROT|nr:site-specific integrase [Azospirillum oryzae]KAA0584842.1 tyrosine-type recombinase/integrase [Azospirillum oryzae]QKS54320.1 site-specific integrase [Azospirillum oryzae]GLR78893.1 hypothetical protein GCM10007856_15670 [Azospirillum oryzae]